MAVPPAADGLDPAFAAQLAQLRARFLAGLPVRRAAIEGAADAAARHAALHQLAGAAGSYGCHALGALARAAMAADPAGEAAALRAIADEMQRLAAG